MDHTESVHANKEFNVNSEKNEVVENDQRLSKEISMQYSPGIEESEIHAHGDRATSETLLDSSVNEEEHESEIRDAGPPISSIKQLALLTGDEREMQARPSQEEKCHDISQVGLYPLVIDKNDTHETMDLLVGETHCEVTALDVINPEESKAEVVKQDVLEPLQNTNWVYAAGDNGASMLNDSPKKFLKNPSYHGTGRLPCPSLGDGWTIEQIVRQQGKSAGRYDTYYHSPLGAKIRSKLKLREFVNVDLTNFDYNSGKFLESGNMVASPKPKSSLLKTGELKTIDRSTENNFNIPSSKQSKKLLIKLPPHKKLLPGICHSDPNKKKFTKKVKKRKLPSSSVEKNVLGMDDDSSQNNPFEAFKMEALSLSSHFEGMKDYDDLIQFAWNFLSIESKARFNDIFVSKISMRPEVMDKRSRLDCPFGSREPSQFTKLAMAGNNNSTDLSDCAISENLLGNAQLDIPIAPQYSNDLNREYRDSIDASKSPKALDINPDGSVPSDDVAIHYSQSLGKYKPHKRKSRVPVYIKQHSNGNEI